MKPRKRSDYVRMYAERLKKDNSLFRQQKMLIESQMKMSSSLFSNMFGRKDFKRKAREYLRSRGLLK